MSLLSFLLIVAPRVPIAMALLTTTARHFGAIDTFMPKETTIQTVLASMESFLYQAIPFFTCAGVVFYRADFTDPRMGWPRCCSAIGAASWHRSVWRCRR